LLGLAPPGHSSRRKLRGSGTWGSEPLLVFADRVEALRAGLRDLGYVEGKNIVLEFRLTEGEVPLREHAAELVGSNVDVIFATSSTEVEVARQATKTIPIVFATHFDPVGVGHVASLARPGGNITGLSGQLTEIAGKALAMLKEAVPYMKKIGVLWSPTAPHQPVLQAIEIAGAKLGVQVKLAPVRTVEEFEGAFAMMAQEHVDAIHVVPSSLTLRGRNAPVLLADLAMKHRLPSMFGGKVNVVAGGLMSYSPNWIELTRQAAIYIDKILYGAKPADLAVEQSSKFEMAINLKTAKALGLTVPPLLVAQADEVIE
jgi:ABC-type uncharacterized transport system substrate-binding protein